MKKKNLIILLIIPFIISLLGIITINVSINTFYGDISSIKWNYEEVEAIKVSNVLSLKATPVNSSNVELDAGNSLIWSVKNKDSSISEPLAEVVYENGNYSLKTNACGEVIVTCSNLKGNIFRKMTVIIYDEGAIILTPIISSSQNNIDDDIYYGQFDLDKSNNKVKASIDFKINVVPSNLANGLILKEKSDNIDFNIDNKKITINSPGDSYIKLAVEGSEEYINTTYNFKVVENGINVYDYDDLMYCTNKSATGEIVVLRKSLESKASYNEMKNEVNNIELFDSNNFKDDVYRFETTYNQEYIKQWNAYASSNKDYKEISNTLVAGIRVQKDFYGNGYSINLHELTYPSLITKVIVNDKEVSIPTPDPNNDLYFGPLSFYTLGDPNGMPLVGAYGQDNVGMYVDGNNITINDVNIKNCDNPQSMSFLSYVGSVIDVHGNNVTISNSRISNGKNVLRCFSTQNFTLYNSLISNGSNFLLEAGSNEYISYDELSKHNFTTSTGQTVNSSLSEYVGVAGSTGDTELNNYLMGSFETSQSMRNSLNSIQNAFNNKENVEGNFKGSLTIKDSYFYNSGIASITLNTMFDGPFLYSASPSIIGEVFSMLSIEGKQVVPFTPTKVAGLSYPVTVDLVGNTKFFDYKDSTNLDISGLITENISYIANEVFGKDKVITIDTIFPIKTILMSEANKKGYVYKGKVNVPIAYYGGGLNLSEVNIDNLASKEEYGESIKIDFLDHYLTPSSGGDLMSMAKDVMLKCVTVVSGFEPFEFIILKGNGYLYDESPSVLDLINNAKGE